MDVTPRPLVVEEKPMVLNLNAMADKLGGSAMGAGGFHGSAIGGPGMMAATGEAGMERRSAPGAAEDAAAGGEDAATGVADGAAEQQQGGKINFRDVLYDPVLSKDPDTDDLCEVRLSETETILLFDKPNNCISNDHEDAKGIEERNEKYKALLALKIQSEKFSEAAAQTLNNGSKDKGVQESAKETHSSGTQATNWDIFDAQKAPEGEGAASTSTKAAGTDASGDNGAGNLLEGSEEDGQDATEKEHHRLLASKTLEEALILVDRSVVQVRTKLGATIDRSVGRKKARH